MVAYRSGVGAVLDCDNSELFGPQLYQLDGAYETAEINKRLKDISHDWERYQDGAHKTETL
jgi:hypothetical protein